MPDVNKFIKLCEVGYIVRACCALCRHSSFEGLSWWGTCGKHKYQHLKHTGDNRQMSINIFGCCDDFEVDLTKRAKLQSFEDLFTGE